MEKKKITQYFFNQRVANSKNHDLLVPELTHNADLSNLQLNVQCPCSAGCEFTLASFINNSDLFRDLQDCILPDIEQILLVHWRNLSDELTSLCIAYDQSLHPNPERFEEWAKGGRCPYDGGYSKYRAIWFQERKECWSPELQPPNVKDLVLRILDEKHCFNNKFRD